ncbi:MAG TPA: aldehyde dehydrogenase family protein, partial [Terriglobales bacterium]|nr:aldehyde dehydrogenase family protein [Terriglobales bacterium]
MPLETKLAPIASVNPATGEVLREFDCTAEEDVRAAVERARAAQPAWHQLGVNRRLQLLRRFQNLLQEKKSEVAAVITREAGKPSVEA